MRTSTLCHLGTPGYKTLRQGRRSMEGHAYHLRTSVRYPDDALLVGSLANAVVESLLAWQDTARFLLLAFVVMPDHVHVLGIKAGAEDLGRLFGRGKGSSSLKVNRILGRSGAFWQDGFYDHLVRREEDVASIGRYIEHNPVRRGLVVAPEVFPYSSACPCLVEQLRGRRWLVDGMEGD